MIFCLGFIWKHQCGDTGNIVGQIIHFKIGDFGERSFDTVARKFG